MVVNYMKALLEERAMKKGVLILIMIVFAISAIVPSGVIAFANMAEPNYTTSNSGVVFTQNEDISVESEILNINLQMFTGEVEAIYNLKNNSSESVTVDAMFLVPLSLSLSSTYGYEFFDNNISIEFGGEELPYTTDYFTSMRNDEVDNLYENWEETLASNDSTTQILGDASGFVKLTYSSEEDFKLYFGCSEYFIIEGDYLRYITGSDKDSDNTLHSFTIEAGETFSLIARQDEIMNVVLEGASEIDTSELILDDVYDYLYQNFCLLLNEYLDINEDLYPALFSNYVRNLEFSADGTMIDQFAYFAERYEYYNLYTLVGEFIGAIQYTMEFEPNESIQLVVKYTAGAGGYSYQGTSVLSFEYLLTPAKYWSDFGSLTINLTVPEDVNNIKSSTLEFEKISDSLYTYTSNGLPNTELWITLNNAYNGASIYTNWWNYYASSANNSDIFCVLLGTIIIPCIMLIASLIAVFSRRRSSYFSSSFIMAIVSLAVLILSITTTKLLVNLFGLFGVFIFPIVGIVLCAICFIIENSILRHRNSN